MKNKNRTKIGLAAFILMLGFICGSIPVSAASSKILVTDNDGDNTISIGDEFCVGAECFYVLANENGKVKALTKYNLKVGGDTFDVAGKAEFTNVDYNTRQKNMMTNNYTECDWKNVNDLYTATVCHSSYNTTYDIIDISNDSDLVDIPSNDFYFALLSNVEIFTRLGADYIYGFFPERDASYKRAILTIALYVRMSRAATYDKENLPAYFDLYGAIIEK